MSTHFSSLLLFFTSHESVILIVNALFAVGISFLYFTRHREKYDAMMIVIIGIILSIVVKYFVEKKIGLETGFGLFALFSLLNFRRTYSRPTIVYIFVTMSNGILASLIGGNDLLLFIAYSGGFVVLLCAYEWYMPERLSCTITIRNKDLGKSRRIIQSHLPDATDIHSTVSSVDTVNTILSVNYREKEMVTKLTLASPKKKK